MDSCSGFISASTILNDLDIEERRFFLVTVHRAENVDREDRLRGIVAALESLGEASCGASEAAASEEGPSDPASTAGDEGGLSGDGEQVGHAARYPDRASGRLRSAAMVFTDPMPTDGRS